jgi:hypothetical protein
MADEMVRMETEETTTDKAKVAFRKAIKKPTNSAIELVGRLLLAHQAEYKAAETKKLEDSLK